MLGRRYRKRLCARCSTSLHDSGYGADLATSARTLLDIVPGCIMHAPQYGDSERRQRLLQSCGHVIPLALRHVRSRYRPHTPLAWPLVKLPHAGPAERLRYAFALKHARRSQLLRSGVNTPHTNIQGALFQCPGMRDEDFRQATANQFQPARRLPRTQAP